MNEPHLIQFLLNIAGAAALLIWAVRLVRTGVERGFANQLRTWLRHSANNRLLAAGSGLGAAVFLQSSTAVAVLTSNFVAKGALTAATGLVILLGADVGSALVTQLLLVRQSFFIPLLLLLGVSLFLRSSNDTLRQVGRILTGLALIFVSLDMIRAATGPMVANPGTLAVMEYLGRDMLTAFVIGAGFAWLVHSSVAAVLLFVTLAGQGILPPTAAAAMILGANLGGAFIAYVLTLSAPVVSRKMIVANLVLRGGGALIAALLVSVKPELLTYLGAEPARQAINLHLVFNVAVAAVALPFTVSVTRIIARVLTDKSAATLTLDAGSALDPAALERPRRGLDCAARELLDMGQRIEKMLIAVEPLYDTWNSVGAQAIEDQDRTIKKMHLEIKLYLAKLGQKGLNEELSRRSMDLASISTSLDAASDAITRTMLELTQRMHAQGVNFSPKGREEIGDFLDRVSGNVQLALNVMMNQNPAEARELVAAKEKVRRVEQKLQRHHLERLREGLVESIETSNIHQETLRALKQINTSFSMVGYPILAKSGDLLKSRLT
ncbi:Na/Pi cotransporter family protein [Sulfitobacter geojensis]|uniref:Na/Pi cotransporter family protein n=1 Tax=Sulfitobacter geojensis TaxID=1342299 RepID=A0AAE2VVN4_9RHOB|nr:Na/Pi cotransporter family protein [Sulfitobacter geojensis]MBM1688240.1 Na/Pi cotransporter family protein [Sulfitobacter geojensis]MBM1692307.1 Na/Pi cotransporter family protein [Sulfitobacter geojensis]MBM1704473.1 Na/Pi cotransporter family protein [Sulfitobacter geojensis]MBM1708531.1 Na/Pi cotransporter family protein [Sulfitobacter geojensis]MBM1712596.1 Na/Pi cotransporter family protein [Sulfitobacter geojensis]